MLLEGGTERGCCFIQIHFRLNHDVGDGCCSLTQRNLLFIKMSGLSLCVLFSLSSPASSSFWLLFVLILLLRCFFILWPFFGGSLSSATLFRCSDGRNWSTIRLSWFSTLGSVQTHRDPPRFIHILVGIFFQLWQGMFLILCIPTIFVDCLRDHLAFF